jgi:phosphate:Na+ symporter
MSISLMNDSGYAFDVTKNLLQMGEVLFATGDIRLREAERSVSLDEDELDEVLQENTRTKPDIENEHS